MKKIYIAGKISGECETPELMQKCIDKFNDYGKSLSFGKFSFSGDKYCFAVCGDIQFTHGFFINQRILGKAKWTDYMKNDIRILLECDEAHFLPDWENSKGANIEHQLCLDLEIQIKYVQIQNETPNIKKSYISTYR